MSWPDSNQRQPLCLPSVLKPAPGNFCITLLGHVTACLKHLKPGHLRCVAWNLMRLGSLHSDIIAVHPQMGQHPVDLQRRSQSLDSMDDRKSLYLRATACRNSCCERVQNANWTFLVCMACIPFNNLQSLQSIKISETKQWSRHTEKISFYILGDTQSNLHPFTCCGENYIIIDWHDTLIWFDLIDQHNILLKMMYWHCAWEHEYDYLLAWHKALGMVNAILCWIKNSYLSQQRQKTFPTTSRVICLIPSSQTRRSYIDPTPGPFTARALAAAK